MVTSISGNNVTWRDSKTGNLITDVHQDLEIVNNRRSNMPYHNGRNGPNGRQQRNTRRRVANNRNNMTACLQGQHWMPAVNGKPGFCMNDSDMTGNQTMGDKRSRGKRKQRWGPKKYRDRAQGGGNGNGIGNQTMGDKRSRGRRRAVRRPRIDRNNALGGGNGTGGINEYGYNLDIYGGGENNQVLTCYCVNPGDQGYCSGGCTPGSCTSSSECSSSGTGGGCGSSALMWCAILGACIAVGAYCASQQGCFIAGTKVKMADGTEKNIEDVEVHDKVVSWNEDTGKIETSTVKTLKQPIHDDMVILEWEHGTTISTFDHPYYSVVKQDWISYKPELTLARYDFDNVGELQVSTPVNPVGDIGLFLDKDENLVESKLLSIKENIGEVQTYIFELEGNNTFFANGILTHNKVIETGETKSGRKKTGGLGY